MQRPVKYAMAMLVASSLLSGCGQKTAEEFMASAQEQIQANNDDAAIIELKNAIAAAPTDPQPRMLLSGLYTKQGQLLAAEKELNRALENGASPDRVFPQLAYVLYHSEQFDATISLGKRLENVQSETIAEVSFYQYLASTQVTKELKAKNEAELRISMSDSDKILAVAYQQLFDAQHEKAEKTLEGYSYGGKRSASLNFLRGALAFQNGEYAAAAEQFESVKEIIPHPNSINFRIVESHLRANQYDEANVWLSELFNINKDHPLTNYYKAQFAYRNENFEDASRYVEVAIQNNVDTTGARVIAAISAYRLASYEQSLRHLRNLKEIKRFVNDDLQRLLAQVQLNLGNAEEAQESLKSIGNAKMQDAGLFAEVGVLLAASGDLSNANSLFEEAQALDAENMTLKMRRAMLNIGADEKRVIQELTAVVEQEPENNWGWMQLATALIRNDQAEQAIELARKWQTRDELNGKILEAFVLTEIGKPDDSIELLNTLAEKYPEEIGVGVNLLSALERSGKYELLYQQAQKILTRFPANNRALIALVGASEKLDRHEQTSSYLKALSKDNDNAVEPLVALAIDARNHNKPDEAISLLIPYKAKLDDLGKMTLGDAIYQTGDISAAMSFYQEWVDEAPGTAVANLRLIGMHEILGDNEKALLLTENAIKQIPGSNVLKLLQINYLTKSGKIDRAKSLLSNIKKLNLNFAESVTLSLYEGQLSMVDLNYAKAIEQLSVYHERSPSFLSAILLAKAMVGIEQPLRAKSLLEEHVANLENVLPRMHHVLAEFYLQNRFYTEAAGYYASIVELNPNDVAALNNLAYVRESAGELEKAKEAASRAYELEPNNPFVMDTLGWIEFKLGNTDGAFALIYKASEMVPASNDIGLHLAELYLTMGQKDRARSVLTRIKKPSPETLEMLKTL